MIKNSITGQNKTAELFSYNFDFLQKIKSIKVNKCHLLLYSTGLRDVEVVKLKPEDIDSKRMLIYVKGAKGRKDRYRLLSDATLKTLREYWQQYKSLKWLFSATDKEKYITIRAAQIVFEVVCERAGVKRQEAIHSPRAPFATHHFEKVNEPRYIQGLSVHKSTKTAEIYKHLSNKDLIRIRNPSDQIL